MEMYGGTVLSGAARWRLGGVQQRKVMGGGFGRLAACAAASHWALRLSKAFRVRGAARSLRSQPEEGGRASAFWHRQGGTFTTVLWCVTATAAPSLASLAMLKWRWWPGPQWPSPAAVVFT